MMNVTMPNLVEDDEHDDAANLWQATCDSIPLLWERMKKASTIHFQTQEKDIRVMYIQRLRGTRRASSLTLDEKVCTGINDLAL